MNNVIQSLVRSLFKFYGAWLVTKGFTVDDNQQEVIAGAIVTICSVIWGCWHRSGGPWNPQQFKFLLMCLMLIFWVSLSGCSRFRAVQRETSTSTNGIVSVRVTRVSASTLWDAHSELAKLRATTSDKTQGLSIGALTESSSGTNAVTLIESVTRAAVTAAVGAVK